jgi:hypothetical protein
MFFAKLGARIASHSVAFAVAAAATAGALTAAEFARARESPLFRIAMRAEKSASVPSTLDADLRVIDREYGVPTADFIRLSLALRERKLTEAAAVCSRLALSRCDPKSLAELRETVAR